MATQGDGVKNFVGILLHVMAAPFFFILLDEPDAFLHPPQAELLGSLLIELKQQDAQLFVATHDADLLRGLLKPASTPLTVVRLDRHTGTPTCCQLSPDDVRNLWSDPLLRYSNVLDGLFHSGVVVCEGDADCRYYGSVLDVMPQERGSPADVLFTHAGGKHRLKVVVTALRAVSVPVAVAADFDVLDDQAVLRPLCEALGGNWTDYEREWRIIKNAMDSMARQPTVAYVREEVTRILDSVTGQRLGQQDEEKIRKALKSEAGWEAAKRGGLASLPQGMRLRLARGY